MGSWHKFTVATCERLLQVALHFTRLTGELAIGNRAVMQLFVPLVALTNLSLVYIQFPESAMTYR